MAQMLVSHQIAHFAGGSHLLNSKMLCFSGPIIVSLDRTD